MIHLATLFGLAGLLLATGLIIHQGFSTVFAALAAAGWGVVWASLFHGVSMALNARAWQVLLPGARPPSLRTFTWLVWVREAVNGLLPVARVGGEIVTARLLIKLGVRSGPAVASLVVDMTVTILTQFLFTLIGVGLLILRHGTDDLVWQILLSLLLALPVMAALALVQRTGLFELFGRLIRTLFGDKWAAIVGSTLRFDRAVRIVYRRPKRVLRCAAWQFAGWAAGSGEIWLALHFLGSPVDLGDAFLIEALIQAVSSAAFVVPAAVGVQEGGFLIVGSLIGLNPEIALALALARRARDLLLFVPALLTWQAQEGRWWLARRA